MWALPRFHPRFFTGRSPRVRLLAVNNYACISATGRYNRVTYSLTMRRVLNTGAMVAMDSLLIASQRCGIPSEPRS
jgi:hypothetical protein